MPYESGEKFTRVMQLFRRLSDTETGVTTKQLAEELEVNQRTVQRYVQMLRDSAGIDIEERDARLHNNAGGAASHWRPFRRCRRHGASTNRWDSSPAGDARCSRG